MDYRFDKIHPSMPVGTTLAEGQVILPDFPRNCVKAVSGIGSGDAYNLYAGAAKPVTTFVASGISPIIIDGMSHTVWTNSMLQAIGIGYIVRWRVRGRTNHDVAGQWSTPPSNWNGEWMPPSTTGIPFWAARFSGGGYIPTLNDTVFSLQDWWDHAVSFSGSTIFLYPRTEVFVRHLLIKPGNQIGVEELDIEQVLIPAHDLITIRIPPNYPSTVRSYPVNIWNRTIQIHPKGTCTTPFVNEGTVHFGTVYPTDFPNNQWDAAATRDFTLTFSNCPRTTVKYYVHANGNRWVGGPGQSVVGVNDSIASDSNPISGNPRGYGIQLQHRIGNHQHTGNIYIHPNEVNPPLSVPYTQSYTRSWQWNNGTVNSSAGVTHTIPLRARLVRTGSSSQQTIQPGSFNTSVIMVIAYP